MEHVKNILREVAGIFMPMSCSGCGADGFLACRNCLEGLRDNSPMTRELSVEEHGVLIPVISAWEYSPKCAGLLNAYKERGVRSLAPIFAQALTEPHEYLRKEILGGSPALWVAPPSTFSNLRHRGYWPVGLIARHVGISLSPALDYVGHHVDHARLGRQERMNNMDHALRARSSVRGKNVILFDDVMTTGATLRESARAILSAGGTVKACLTLASAP